MKVYISADIEGIGCVVRSEHSSPSGREYQWARKRMTEEVNAAVRGAFSGGAREVVVADSHNVGLNLMPDVLDPRAALIMGSPRPLSMMEGIQSGFDAVFLVGYHSMAGTANSTIVHIYTRRIAEVKFNDIIVGEIGISAALAGYFGIPVTLVTGDDKAILEAKSLLGDIETVEVKKGIGSYAALCLHPNRCSELIQQAALRAMSRIQSIKPFRLSSPVQLEVTFATSSSADRAAQIPGVERVSGITVTYRAKDVLDAFRMFHVMAELMELVPFI